MVAKGTGTPDPRQLGNGVDLAAIAAGFDLPSRAGAIEPLGNGLINETFRVVTGGSGYVLQRINTQVFNDPELIMSNLSRLAEHLGRVDSGGLRIPAPIRARDGSTLVRGPGGSVWRMMELIPDVLTLTRIETADQAWEIGGALGRFHRLTLDMPLHALGATLPGLHDTPAYLRRLLEVRKRGGIDIGGAELGECFAFIDAREGLVSELDDARLAGRVAPRVIHGDPKADNFLFGRLDHRALALIDLDTVQPGLIQHDLGDCLRSCCNRVGESPDGLPSASFDLDLCASVLGAYAAEMGPLLTRDDIALLYDSIRLLPFELALRFLTDHLVGDRWFKVTHRGQNLHKARVQLALVADIESKAEPIRRVIARSFRLQTGTIR